MESTELKVKLESFEGPLDLLLHLIDKNKVNIYDIPIALITKQYMEYLEEMKRQDLNIMSDFLLMAATLLDIKAKMLLPAEINEEGEEVDLSLFGGHHCTTQLCAFSKCESGTYLVLQGCDDGNYLMR